MDARKRWIVGGTLAPVAVGGTTDFRVIGHEADDDGAGDGAGED